MSIHMYSLSHTLFLYERNIHIFLGKCLSQFTCRTSQWEIQAQNENEGSVRFFKKLDLRSALYKSLFIALKLLMRKFITNLQRVTPKSRLQCSYIQIYLLLNYLQLFCCLPSWLWLDTWSSLNPLGKYCWEPLVLCFLNVFS